MLDKFVEKLGIEPDDFKIRIKRITLDEAVTGYVSKLERTVQERIGKQIEEAKKR